MKKLLRPICLLLCLLMLTGCSKAPSSVPWLDLPAVQAGPEAPVGDAGLQHDMIAALYLPSLDKQSLLTVFEPISISRALHPAEAILRALLNHPGNQRVRPLGGSVTLMLAGASPVEISGRVCTVHLSANALMLSTQDLFTAALAITATLCELDDIDYVNLLVAGVPLAVDVAGNLPLGTLSAQLGQELSVLWEQAISRRTPVGELPAHTPLTSAATLYFPLQDGTGIISEPRRISFPGQHPQQLVTSLLEALSAGADTLAQTPDMPDLNAMLIFAPEVTELDSGGRRITLHFTSDVEQRLLSAGCDPVCTFAAMTTTLTTFVPSAQQVCILVGDGALSSLYSPVMGSLLFPGALQTRADFAPMLMEQTVIYAPSEGRLRPMARALPYRSACNPRTLLLTLSEQGVIPMGLTDADVLGLSILDGTLLVNFSQRYAQIIQASATDQRLIAYALVNTLCETLDIRRVRFYFSSEAVDHLDGDLLWSGMFLYNPALIAP